MPFLKRYYAILLLLLVWAMHLPFITADPDSEVDVHTRGAWTDEGLYPIQSRNFVNHGVLNLKENDTFVRGPVYQLIMIPFFAIFGVQLEVSRMVVLLLLYGVLAWFATRKRFRFFTAILLLVVMTQFQVFHFSHYGLAYMICVSFLLLSFYFFDSCYSGINRKKHWKLLLSAFFIFLCYATTIQLINVILLLPAATFFVALAERNSDRKSRWLPFGLSILYSLGFLGVYFVAWYLPNKSFYDYLLTSKVGSRFPSTLAGMIDIFLWKFREVLLVDDLKLIVLGFLLLLVFGVAFIIFKKVKLTYRIPLIFSLVWLLAEVSKLTMPYLPYRYLMSFLLALGVSFSLVLTEIAFAKKWLKGMIVVFACGVFVFNTLTYSRTYQRRTFAIRDVNKYLANYDFGKSAVIGPWAPTFTWKSKAYSVPVWKDYLNHHAPVQTFRPRVIVSEFDENDSGEAFRSQGIDLDAISDSARLFHVWRYKIYIYWINMEKADSLAGENF